MVELKALPMSEMAFDALIGRDRWAIRREKRNALGSCSRACEKSKKRSYRKHSGQRWSSTAIIRSNVPIKNCQAQHHVRSRCHDARIGMMNYVYAECFSMSVGARRGSWRHSAGAITAMLNAVALQNQSWSSVNCLHEHYHKTSRQSKVSGLMIITSQHGVRLASECLNNIRMI